ncbi:MAG: cbb3-type cytochrome c oxidase N-terminal domain-containing protein [Gemmatimonadaceae bacterium]
MAGKDTNESRLIDHNYDGIQEYDNPLPRWWVYLFYATIIFAVLYYFNVPGVGIGKGRIADYEADMAAAKAKYAAVAATTGGETPTPEQLAAAATDQNVVAAGKAVFATNCVACHKADGGGMIGPNLTDDFWIHGGTLPEIRNTIDQGVLAKGMPQWGKVLKPADITAAAVYVTTLHGTNPPGAKAPEGTNVAAPPTADSGQAKK